MSNDFYAHIRDLAKTNQKLYSAAEIFEKLRATERDYHNWILDTGRVVMSAWLDRDSAYEFAGYLSEQGNPIAKKYVSTQYLDDYLLVNVDTKVTQDWKHPKARIFDGVPNPLALSSAMILTIGNELKFSKRKQYQFTLCFQLLLANPTINTSLINSLIASRSTRNWNQAAEIIAETLNF